MAELEPYGPRAARLRELRGIRSCIGAHNGFQFHLQKILASEEASYSSISGLPLAVVTRRALQTKNREEAARPNGRRTRAR